MPAEDLTKVPIVELMARAAQLRDDQWGKRITYSPKVFVPLTRLCRDACGYCTFVRNPSNVESAYLDLNAVVDIARQGERAGCTEALITLGENPEMRYPAARAWLDEHGYRSTVHYVRAACAAILENTTLLPHANAGAIAGFEMRQLREVAISQGMMVESVDADLSAHKRAPDKQPARRMMSLEDAGRERIPFTTGILVGIGENVADRVKALRAIARCHARHGHVAEVIVQNFRPKEATVMRHIGAPPSSDHLQAIALARLLLPPEVHVQAPPNLSDDFGSLIDAGIDDFGGVSPVTADHVNPERPWPALAAMKRVAGSKGFALEPRLPAYPEFLHGRWVDAGVLRRVTARWPLAVGG